ncbi:hypothetical protein SAMN05877753_102407 [Bacillus oleivorans]|uniref:Uncharacterized protein n=1 Tax=Bacillus oleivorans TaxID=1448271 RepID=A0A285CKX4_9BACI|nr:hypothetical protein [Bacillus oleivorans]SNX68200.1 hypothetical protein SAMN05877753_102407 [Bacillus oleivorans]
MIKFYCNFCRTIANEPGVCRSCGKNDFTEIKISVQKQPNYNEKNNKKEGQWGTLHGF